VEILESILEAMVCLLKKEDGRGNISSILIEILVVEIKARKVSNLYFFVLR